MSVARINPFTAIHYNSRLLTYVLNTLVAYIANNMDPDQTAPLGAVWSGFVVFVSKTKVVWTAFEYMQQT